MDHYPEERQTMRTLQQWRSLRTWQRGAMLTGLALVGLSLTGLAIGAAGSPKMQVLPSPKGVKYSQNVEVKAQNLPKGSGTIALTICGLTNAKGAKIASPTADDCAGQNDLSSGLVKLQTWKDGTFDQHYVLPKSGQKFGKNQRFCDAKHICALVVADANPSAPAYHVSTELQFTDQKSTTSTTKPKTTTTKPKTTTTKKAPTTTTTTSGFSLNISGNATAGSSGGSGGVTVKVNPGGSVPPLTAPPLTLPAITVPGSTPANPIPPQVGDAVMQACDQLAQVVKQGGGDASSLSLACSTLVNGGGGAQLAALLESPSLGCIEASSLTQGNAQLAAACNQLATALQPYSSQLGGALAPILGLLP
jgi:hypothetical protein